MPKYIADAYLLKEGKVVQPGNEIELTEQQAKKLRNKLKAGTVLKSNEEKEREDGTEEHTDASLKKLSADEQKELVSELEGNLDELTNEEKRIQFIIENQ
ncbi:hypothetical protein [Halobacillus seohaensis]|uniref:YqbF C-terminal domain-containing protein n=1 Tax=Halobacillus seohaensis TaxID=447421 RepID=A0ABW2ES91_9BACI